VLDNPTNFLNPFQFEITFECLQELDDGKRFVLFLTIGCTIALWMMILTERCTLTMFSHATDLEWRVLYVGSAHDSHQDQILDEVLVGPVPVGLNKFVLQADAPNFEKLPENDVLGVTVVLVTCSYKDREFVRIGYYVNNEYMGYDHATPESINTLNDELATEENDDNAVVPEETTQPPPPSISLKDIDFSLVQRQILADRPRVTKFPIPWGNEPTTSTMSTALSNTTHMPSTSTDYEKRFEEAGTPSTAATEEMEAES
jgi:histone chaperone ASF1